MSSITLAVFLSISGSLYSKNIVVPTQMKTFAEAIQAFSAGFVDTVYARPGAYTEIINWPSKDGLKLISLGDSSNTILDYSMTISVASLTPASVIKGFSIRSMTLSSSITVSNCWFSGGSLNGLTIKNCSPQILNTRIENYTGSSGIYCSNAVLYLNNVFLYNNGKLGSGTAGAITAAASKITLLNSVIDHNLGGKRMQDLGEGGGIYLDKSECILTNCTIVNNTSSTDGGGIYGLSKSLVITNCTFANNTSSGSGGAIHFSPISTNTIIGDVTIDNSRFIGNYARNGAGGIILSGSSTKSSIRIENLTLMNNSTEGNGGAMIISGAITKCNIYNNRAGLYGGAYYGGTITLENCNIGNNVSSQFALYANTNVIKSSNVFNNISTGSGYSIYLNDVNSSIANSNIFGNELACYAPGSAAINAKNNWWGDPSGPYHIFNNPTGKGDTVNMVIDPLPFLTNQSILCPPLPVHNVQAIKKDNGSFDIEWCVFR